MSSLHGKLLVFDDIKSLNCIPKRNEILNLPDNEIKTKFVNWSNGYDFAVIDII